MEVFDLNQEIKSLREISDQQISAAVRDYGIDIADEKYVLGFSSYGLTRWLSGIHTDVLKINAPSQIPVSHLDSIRWKSVFMYRGYIAFLFLRSETLESGLDNIPPDSCLQPFRQFYRSSKKSEGGATTAQHIRNAFAHGTVDLQSSSRAIITDRDWVAHIKPSDFVDGLCEEIFRFYLCSFKNG